MAVYAGKGRMVDPWVDRDVVPEKEVVALSIPFYSILPIVPSLERPCSGHSLLRTRTMQQWH